jgi:thioesterase domain-containing protein
MVSAGSLVMPVQTRGSKPPFFCVANPFICYQLASYVGTDQPIYEVRKPALSGKRLPFPQIKELATRSISDIKRIQPEGPYFVGGHSASGGNLALEMTHQLLARGDSVGLLVIFDMAHPTSGRSRPSHMMERLVYQARQMKHLGLKDQASGICR